MRGSALCRSSSGGPTTADQRPDLIGGGEAKSFTDAMVPDQELVVRSTQCQALTPMMQFMLQNEKLSKKELKELRKAIDDAK